jgi:hypothetical protein
MMNMVKREMPESIYIQCPDCDDLMDHDILKGRMGNDNITGTFPLYGMRKNILRYDPDPGDTYRKGPVQRRGRYRYHGNAAREQRTDHDRRRILHG